MSLSTWPLCYCRHYWPWHLDHPFVILVWYSWLRSQLVQVLSLLPGQMWNRPSCLPGTHPAAVSRKALAVWSFTLRQRSVSVKQTAKLQRRWERRRGMMQLVISWFSRWRELTKCRGESAVVVLAWYAVLLAQTPWTWHAPFPASTQTVADNTHAQLNKPTHIESNI